MIQRSFVTAVGALALLAGAAGAAVVGSTTSFAITGEASGATVSTVTGTLAATPRSVLLEPGMHDAHAPSASVPGVLEASSLFAITTGNGEPGNASTQSTATVDRLSILGGLVTADGAVAMSTSYASGTTLGSTGAGTTFANLVVNGVAITTEVAPNTRIGLPGVGYVVLNEQIPEGDGVSTTGLRVTAIRVVTQNPLTGSTTGEITVASARSAIRQ